MTRTAPFVAALQETSRTRSVPAVLASVAGLVLAAVPVRAQSVVFSQDFESALSPSINPGVALITPEQGYAGLGHAGNMFAGSFLRSPTGNLVTLTLTGLPTHSSISVLFLFAAIDSLDGTGTYPQGDFMDVTLDGTTFFHESFANALPTQIQSYNPPPGVQLARHVDLGFSGPGSYYTDSAYDLSLDPVFQHLPHTASTATITFQIEGPGIQPLSDESWAMDNLRIAIDGAAPLITAQPAPATACPSGTATFSVAAPGSGLTFRWQREIAPAGSNTWTDLSDGPFPGSAALVANSGTSTLSITNADSAAAVRYCCVITSAFGGVASAPATLAVQTGGYANCDASTAAPALNVADFTCFLQKYAAGDPYANCDGSTSPPVLNVADFTCFLQKYAAGCP